MTKDLLTAIGWILVTGALLSGILIVAIVARRIAIERPGGTVECSLRRADEDRWRSGIAAYRPTELAWYRAVGVRLRPEKVFERRSLRVITRQPERLAAGASAGPPGQATIVVQFETGDKSEPVWLAMSQDALTGFLAWVEAAPQHVPPAA